MNKKLICAPGIIFALIFTLFTSAFGQETIRFKTIRATDGEAALLAIHFAEYTLASLNTETVDQLLKSANHFEEMHLEVDQQTYRFSLRAKDIRAPHYKLRAWTPQGSIELPRSPNKTYAGKTLEGNFDVRITADDDFFSAMIVQEKDEIYIERARNIIPDAAINQFVIYKGSDNLKQFGHENCGTACGQTHYEGPDDAQPLQPGQGNRACKELEIAIADDYRMFDDYGSVGAVEDHNLAVINNVQTNYDFEFNDDLEFVVVEIFVATSPANDPWYDGNNIYDMLDDFTDWGPSGFSNVHDVGAFWSARNFATDVIGVAWLNAICTSIRYHVLEDFTGNAQLLRVLQAHEMGHNFSANHDAPNSGFIMQPSVSNTNTWSNASLNSINNYINQINCLGPCGIPEPPVADFDADPTEGCVPMEVQFTDESENNPTSWFWTFEGGSPSTSTAENPVVTYNDPGQYDVTLEVANAAGDNSLTKFNYIVVGDIPFADFDFTINELEVDFQNNSFGADSYEWDFGDGNNSNSSNPLHMYEEDGIYTVTLYATNECGTDEYSVEIEIITLPFANFSSDITEGCSPIEVQFYNLSSDNADFFTWSFPGGSPSSSNDFEPVVLYETPGTYNVTLVATNDAGDDVYTLTNYITVLPQPNAEFNYTTNGLEVTFNSTGSFGDTYSWDFGDLSFSSEENPVHVYDESGTYQVILTVTNECGSSTLQLAVTVTGAPSPAFGSDTQYGCAPLVVQFMDMSGGSPTSYSWVFEGGNPATSNAPNPVVTYNTPGLYDVQLTVSNSTGSETITLNDYIEVEFPTNSDFSYNVNGLEVTFTNLSLNAISSSWDFGDGFNSSDTNPIHGYLQDGTYTVTLISEGICGDDTSTHIVNIQTPPHAGYSFQASGDCVPVMVTFENESSSNSTSYKWLFPGGNPSMSTAENPVVTYQNAGTYNVTLIAFSGGGSDTVTTNSFITVGDVPNAAFLLTTDELTVNFNNTSTNADAYQWFFGDGSMSAETSPVYTYQEYGAYNVMLIATNDCGNDTSFLEIVLSTVPNASFGYSAHNGCAPFSVSFFDQSQNNPTSWNWTFEGGDPATSTEQNPVVTYSTPGIYSVNLLVTNSEGSDALHLDGLIEVGGTPDADFEHQQTENVVALEYLGTDYDSLRWYFGDGRTDTSLNPTAEYNTSGEYEISLIVYNPCGSDTASIWVTIIITATQDPNFNEYGWEIRPSPFSDVFTVYGKPLENGTAVISLMDVQGRLISTDRYPYQSGETSVRFDNESLPQGLILVVIQDDRSITVLKALHQ